MSDRSPDAVSAALRVEDYAYAKDMARNIVARALHLDYLSYITYTANRIRVAHGLPKQTGMTEREVAEGRLRRIAATGLFEPCCSSHGALLCHLCYRLTHFVEVCGCPTCLSDGLPRILGERERWANR